MVVKSLLWLQKRQTNIMCKNSLQNYQAKIVRAVKADEMIQGLHWFDNYLPPMALI